MIKKPIKIVVLILCLIMIPIMNLSEEKVQNTMTISEVCLCNFASCRFEDGSYPFAWIEVCVPDSVDANVSGCAIVADSTPIQSAEVQNGSDGCVTFLLDEENATAIRDAKMLSLYYHDTAVDAFSLEEAKKAGSADSENQIPADLSLGVCRSEVCWLKPSPGHKNLLTDVTEPITLGAPSVSVPAGFYRDAIEVAIIPTGENETIYYTLDGSKPTRKSNRYYGPITINDATQKANRWSKRSDLSVQDYYVPDEPLEKCSILQAVAYDANGHRSAITTASYFVGAELYEKYPLADIPVLSISADAKQLYDEKDGALVLGKTYTKWLSKLEENLQGANLAAAGGDAPLTDHKIEANFRKKSRKWEVPVTLEYFKNGELTFSQTVGLRNKGVTSSDGTQKCFNLYAREMYDGNDTFTYDVLGSGRLSDVIALKPWDGAFYDGLLTSLVSGDTLLPLHYQPVVVFLEGEYWGVYTLLEKYNAQFFEDHFGISADELQVIKNMEDAAGTEGGTADYLALVEWAKSHDLSLQANYDELCNQIDIDSLIDWYCANIYMDNIDGFEDYNILRWRSKDDLGSADADGKWHWALYDMDSALRDATRNNMTEDRQVDKPAYFHHELMSCLLLNESFKERFVTRFEDMMNQCFDPKNVEARYFELAEKTAPFIAESVSRFTGDNYTEDYFCEREVESKLEFWKERRENIEAQLEDLFLLQ